ncbi:MAG: zinc ribbon domain-containing protein [Candidatus Omnitrophica bacterium]|nr:zinc ribbon domain-containing protein [Candidatus Omnitrophota bacterium]MBU4478324.1 zinc ribbon domain-containing protein [Candidatus Omnitrophota bacterium]MCG2704252.1 zinc ribbon domain-containing protein [Candidatus Omnitrophota bacterium]
MPIYEYQCRECDKTSEFLVGVVQLPEEIRCKHCGSKKIDKKISGGFVASSTKKTKGPSCVSGQGCDSAACLYGKHCH